MNHGAHQHITNADYHAAEAASKSTLDVVHKAPVNLRAAQLGLVERTASPSQAIGTAFHALVLEPEVFAETYALPFIAPADALATTDDLKSALDAAGIAYKASAKKDALTALVREHVPGAVILADAQAAYAETTKGKEVISADVWAMVHRMRDATMAHTSARKLLTAEGFAEVSMFWREPVIDPATGEHMTDENGEPAYMEMRCRPDYYRADGVIVDLKSTSPGGASPDEFGRSIYKWRYHVQDALYMRGTGKALAVHQALPVMLAPPRAFVFIAVETDAMVVDGVAKGVGVYLLDDECRAIGLREMQDDILTLWRCRQFNRWPGYSEDIAPISLPGWAMRNALTATE